MRFDDRFLEEIKSRVRLSDVIGKTVKLKRQGREYAGLSPFTKEKTPSFFVNDDKGFWHDFSSGKHGDLIGFLQEVERLSFPEAVERLASEAGVPMPAPDPKAAERETRRLGLQEWLELAQKWFASNLRRQPGKEARAYLERRGLPEDQWERFGLGYAPANRTGLKEALVQRGARPADLVEAGLLIMPEGGGQPYDRFRDRIMFPIHDARGRIVSFGGRAMNPDDRAKYLNGPETSLFHKGSLVYGLPEARRLRSAGGEDQPIVVVEGYMDVIACQRAGVAAVAPMGTALTEEQMEVLWRLDREPVLCFDGDKAGLRAAYRAVDRALPQLKPGRSFRFVLLTGGQDPDDVLREKGALALRDMLSRTRPLVEVLFQKERDAEPLDTPERRAGFKQRLRMAASAVPEGDLAAEYRRQLLAGFDQMFPRESPMVRDKAPWRKGGFSAPGGSSLEGKAAAASLKLSIEPTSAAVAQGALDDPARLDDHLEALQAYGFGDPALTGLAREIIRVRLDADSLDSGTLKRHLAQAGLGASLREIERAALKSGAPFLSTDMMLADARVSWSQAFEVLTRLAALEEALDSAKSEAGSQFDAEAFKRLKAERDALRRAVKLGTIWSPGAS
ncbi:MAG: DNA primase [Caulobacteraceae bacterium]|nr:DNA primase [Caulobacteraceae bacterium]